MFSKRCSKETFTGETEGTGKQGTDHLDSTIEVNPKKMVGLLHLSTAKLQSHDREKRYVETILPVTKWIVETAPFDIHKITNPNVSGTIYQSGNLKRFYNSKSYVLHRDNYTFQKCKNRSKDSRLECHQMVFRSSGRTNRPDNLTTLCKTCHDKLHNDKLTSFKGSINLILSGIQKVQDMSKARNLQFACL